jgi:YfiH family protein
MVQMNRARFTAAIGAAGWPIIKLKQVHSNIVVDVIDTSAAGAGADNAVEGDAAITDLPGVILGVLTADCAPILIADREGLAVAAVHAGWRGTAAGIAGATVERLVARFGTDPEHLVAVIGPHIGACCYEVGEDVAAQIDVAAIVRMPEFPKPHIDLAAANRAQLARSGIPESQIETSSLCTKCRDDLFHSYRRDGKAMGHMLSVIGIAP